jgi:hypothetical protein
MKRSLSITMCLAALSLAASAQADITSDYPSSRNAQVEPQPGLRIGSVRAAGSGCPDASVDVPWFNPERTIFTVTPKFGSPFGVDTDAGDSLGDKSWTCTFRIALDVPAGFTDALATVTFWGVVRLEPSQTAELTVRHGFEGGASVVTREPVVDQQSGLNSPWASVHKLTLSEGGGQPCEGAARQLVIDATITIHGTEAGQSGYVMLSQLAGEVGPAVGADVTPNVTVPLESCSRTHKQL